MGIIEPATLRDDGVVSDEALTIVVSVRPHFAATNLLQRAKEKT
jgi:hypothetical protein